MTVIHVPRPDPKKVMDPSRPVNALLKAQIQHLYDAELKLPAAHQSNVYINAIKTEGEAADYVRRVTEAIHQAHRSAAVKRKTVVKRRATVKRKRGMAIAAAADQRQAYKSSKARRGRAKRKGKGQT